MPGRGPVPKRTSERLGHLTKAQKAAATQVDVSGAVTVPEPSSEWHEVAIDWYRSLGESGQAKYLEPSDWQAARVVAEQLSKLMRVPVVDAPSFRAVWSAMGDLLTTEASRRRVKVEVNRRPLQAVAAPVAKMDDYRDL